MKKSLVLAMAMALGVTASAYAANPFSDVPAGHWAYDSIDKLAAAGVVDGMGDGTFQGDRTMTRYEMAQIVAKAMAKGANVEKLAAEFADELDALGVRVAALEKKADNVKISGQFRAKYVAQHARNNDDSYQADFRSRIWIKGQVNDDWAVTAMLQNTEYLAGADKDVNEENVTFQRAYVEGKIGGLAFVGGRYDTTLADGAIYDTRLDGVEVNYGSKIKVRGMFGKMTDGLTMPLDPMGGNYAALEAQGDIAKGLTLKAGYVNINDLGVNGYGEGLDNAIWHVGLDYTVGDFNFTGKYLKGKPEINGTAIPIFDKKGFTYGVSYKGADAEQVGSWGIFANYYNQPQATFVAHTTDANTFSGELLGDGFKGYGIGANYTVAKNIIATAAYYNTRARNEVLGEKLRDERIWTDLTFSF